MGEDEALEREIVRQHIKRHGDGKGQTTTVPQPRGFSQVAGDLADGQFILVAFKGKKKANVLPPRKTRKQVRSCDATVFGPAGVYASRLLAVQNIDRFREAIEGG